MTETAATLAASPHGGRSRSPWLIPGLAVTQTVAYGVLYYAFSVLLTPIAAELHTSTAAVTGALTTSVVVAAGAAVPVGHWLDRHGGRALMTAGSVLGVAAVVGWSRVHELWQLYPVFILIGLASAATLYEAAFPVVIASTSPRQRGRDLLTVTIVAGFSSSIFFPLTGLLLQHLGWRTTLLVLAALMGIITIPVHALFVPARGGPHARHRLHGTGASVGEALRDKRFWLYGAAFVAQAAAVSAVGVLLVTYLRHRGHAATVAAFLSGLLGILSVTGRLVTTAASRRRGMATATAAVFAVQSVGIVMLALVGRSIVGAAACVVAFGLGFGVATIARPAILADRYGTSRYATIAAAMAVPITLARAFAPLAAAAAPADAFLVAAALLCLLSAALLAFADVGASA